MTTRSWHRAAPALLASTLAAWGAAADDSSPPPAPFTVEYPADGAVVGPSACGLFVAGRAGLGLDLVIVIDTSVSTAKPSGGDIDGDGELGQPVFGAIGYTRGEMSSDVGDTVLAAEVAAARALLPRLDPQRTRVALVTFSGGPPNPGAPPHEPGGADLPAALTRQGLSNDHLVVDEALHGLLREIPAGGTHMAAGVDQATIELLGLQGARSTPEPGRARSVLLLTDGRPTLPYGVPREADNLRAALRAAERTRTARVRVTTVAVGPDALAGPIAALEIARITGGLFVPVRRSADLVLAVDSLDLAGVGTIELRNATTDEPAQPFASTPDGAWGGFVPVVPGANRIEVVARTPGQAPRRRTLTVVFDPEAPPATIPRELDIPGARAVTKCLRENERTPLSVEEARVEEARRVLQLEIQRERARARKRAAEQRKELELEAETGEPG